MKKIILHDNISKYLSGISIKLVAMETANNIIVAKLKIVQFMYQ